MSRRSAHPLRAVLAGLLAAAAVAACGGGTPATTTAEPVEAPTGPAAPLVDPLTGVGPPPTGPLVAVKVDDVPSARPFHTGLDAAAVVYVELVEGGATRLLALYSQPPNAEVGPIRSLRESDMELLAQHGPVALAFSGANDGVLGTFHAAVAAGQLVDVSYGARPELYRIGERRSDVKNFYALPAALAQAAPGAGAAKDVGWTFDPAARPEAAPAATTSVVMSDEQVVDLRYDTTTGRYAVLQDGRPLNGAAPANVLVQQVAVFDSEYRDVTGARSPYTATVGSGVVDLLRDGSRTSGRWERPTPADGTRLLDAAGAPLALRPGPTWVLLQPAGLPTTSG